MRVFLLRWPSAGAESSGPLPRARGRGSDGRRSRGARVHCSAHLQSRGSHLLAVRDARVDPGRTMTCAACGAVNREGRKFCAECGSALAVSCSACGAANEPGERFCGDCGTGLRARDEPPSPPLPPAPEVRRGSVLFCDLVGYTALAEQRDAEDVRAVLSGYFDVARTVVRRYGGAIEKYIGDAVVAVWGVPAAHEDDAERAAR